MTRLLPRNPVPPLDLPTVGGSHWRLEDQSPDHFTMIVVYRGLHCPICKPYLRDLDRKLGDFKERGVQVIAVSTDDAERAEKTKADWGIENLTIGYDLKLADARAWGLFISHAIGDHETPEFAEPGVFLVRPDGTLYLSIVNSMPFARPHFADLLQGLDYAIPNNYPARGEAA